LAGSAPDRRTAIRITAGTLRGRRIDVPAGGVRPTSERARQAYFNIVGDRIAGARFLDLFAGTGIFSFEAVSRGAREAVAVDSSRTNAAAIERNAREWNVPVRAAYADALVWIKRPGTEVFDVIYADPPYAYEQYDDLLMTIDTHAMLGPAAIIAIEHRRRTDPFCPATLTRLRHTRTVEYGEVRISFFEREAA
jgi:16S rRNA (guanine966-N2)-methyltransferase